MTGFYANYVFLEDKLKRGILILDFGSQYTQLIARRIREIGVYSEIYPFSLSAGEIQNRNPYGIVLSGGPASVLMENSPSIDMQILNFGVPVLGICYGMQLLAKLLGGEVKQATQREYGKAILKNRSEKSLLLQGVRDESVIWMSHGDSVVRLPEGFHITALTLDGTVTAIENNEKKWFGVQFHPEVAHTEEGGKILSNFVLKVCQSQQNWSMNGFVEEEMSELREKCQGKKVILGVSGGVDSTTLAVMVQKALGNSVKSVFINNGLLRLGEEEEVLNNLQKRLKLNVEYVDASEVFIKSLKGIESPEEKRKIIGKTFIDIFYKSVGNFDFLVQGTLYPDVIESNPVKGPSQTIKTHHNRVKEVERLEKEGRVIEPFKFLFKDEVRRVAEVLNIPDDILNRHPFPGPGLAVRIIGDVTKEKLSILRMADSIFIEELKKSGWYERVWQAFAVLLPVKSVGVMGDERAYGNVIALRAITSVDGMTANWAAIPYEILDSVSNKIIRSIKEVNRVVYDVTSKPPATIEWE